MTPATLEQASKEDLKDELLRIKSREKKAKDDNKKRMGQFLGTGITLVTAGGLGYLLGDRANTEKKKDDFAGKSEEDQQKALDDAQSIAGVPIDALVGAIGILGGLSDAAGEFSGTLLAVGTGGLSSFASRTFYKRAEAAKEEASS